MKNFMLLCLCLSACSSWKQKDFEKSLEKPAGETRIEVPQEDQKILDQFEVTESAAIEEEKKSAPVVSKTKPVVKKVVKSAPVVQNKKENIVVDVPAVKTLPTDYPEELTKINEKAKKVWDVYQPNHKVGQKVFLDVHYMGMTVGKIIVTNEGRQKVKGKEAWHFHARFKSAPFYSNIYELDDTVDTHVVTDGFLAARYTLIQRESKQSVDDVQLFDRDVLKSFWFYKQKKENGKIKNKDLKNFMPFYSMDPFSVLFFYQGLPLKDGDKYDIPLVNKGKVLILRSQVEGREKIDTDLGEKNAIRIHATTQYTGETLKSGDLMFWFSDDSERKLLKAKAKIKIGSVTADIVKE